MNITTEMLTSRFHETLESKETPVPKVLELLPLIELHHEVTGRLIEQLRVSLAATLNEGEEFDAALDNLDDLMHHLGIH